MTDPMSSSWAVPEGGTPSGMPDPAGAGASPPSARSTKKSGNLWNVLLGLAALVAVAGIAFAGGRVSAPAAVGAIDAAGTGRRGAANQSAASDRSPGPGSRNAGGSAGSRMISGIVQGIDGSTLTIVSGDGTETTIDVSAATYHAQAPATAADVTQGSKVSVTVAGSGRARQNPSATSATGPGAGSGTVRASDVTIISTP
jgi:hypothetical protein